MAYVSSHDNPVTAALGGGIMEFFFFYSAYLTIPEHYLM